MRRVAKNPPKRAGTDANPAVPESEQSSIFVVDTPPRAASPYFASFKKCVAKHATVLKKRDIANTFRGIRGNTVWFASDDSFVPDLMAEVHEPTGNHRLIIFEAKSNPDLANMYFRHVMPRSREVHLLPPEELAAVLISPRREELFIGGMLKKQDGLVVLFRGNMEPIVVPLVWFRGAADTSPDLTKFGIADFGNTVAFGDFEAAADAILYEFDPEYRKTLRARERERDNTFGGSLRRLRIQKGLSRADFSGVTEKTMARLERNEVDRPRAKTLQAIAKRLGVTADELGTF